MLVFDLIYLHWKFMTLKKRWTRQNKIWWSWGWSPFPYIFIICSEVLSGLCIKAQENGSLPGLRVALGCRPVNHLLFADDTMFFCRSDHRSCQTLKAILRKYENASGQKINQSKSSITFCVKTPAGIRERTKLDLDIQKEGGQGKYLGLPELFGRRSTSSLLLLTVSSKKL